MQGLCGTVCRRPISSLLLVLRVLCWVYPISIHLLYASLQHFHGKAAGALVCNGYMVCVFAYGPKGSVALDMCCLSAIQGSCPLLSKPLTIRVVPSQLLRFLCQIRNACVSRFSGLRGLDSCNVLPCLEGLYHNAHLLICMSQGDFIPIFFICPHLC